ncbi:MAG: glycosyltransferase [Caldilineaceae bacterium]|nr:glycosyltransferase [Caldilineaceae bacterium]
MKILISTFGTLGDVQPYLALAVGLRAAGHDVTLVTSASYTPWIARYGIQHCPTQLDIQAIQSVDCVIQSPTGCGAMEAAERLGIPACFAVPVPFAPTGAFPSFFQPLRRSLGRRSIA